MSLSNRHPWLSALTLVLTYGILGGQISLARQKEVRAWLTRVDEGDRLRLAQEQGNAEHDGTYWLFREQTLGFQKQDAGVRPLIMLDPAKTYQAMVGYGAALTESSAFLLINLKEKNPALYSQTMERLFSPTRGAGLSLLRLPMGSSDYVATDDYYTYCDQESRDLSAFSIARDEKYVIPVIQDAIKLNPDLRLIGSPWSPPAWMKTNMTLLGTTSEAKAAGTHNRLKADCFSIYAKYFVKFVQAYKAAGISVYGVTLQNEPQFDTARYPCLRMDENDQILLVKELGPKLVAAGLTTKVFIHDHNWALHPNDQTPVGGDAKLNPVESVTKILSDPVAGPYIAGSAWHCYFGGVKEMREAYETIHKRFPDKQILTTEASAWGKNRGAWWGDVEWAMSHNFLGSTQKWSEASLEWNLALDQKFGPTLRADSEGVGLVTVDSDRFQFARFEREFYAMAQMSRAAQPGSVRVDTSMEGDTQGLDVVAFQSGKEKSSSLVVFNRSDKSVSFQVKAGSQYVKYQIPGRSIVTLAW